MSFAFVAEAADPVTTLDPASQRVLATQVALDRAGFSPGALDGKTGGNTSRALRAFQQAQGLPATGELDSTTVARLGAAFENPLLIYSVTSEDVTGPYSASIPVDMMKKAELESLGYTSVREMLAERFHVSEKLLERLNPKARYQAGEIVLVPNVEPFMLAAATTKPATEVKPAAGAKPVPAAKPAAAPGGHVVTVTDATKTLQVEDAAGQVIFHAPVTTGSGNDPLPVGEWKVNGVQRNPTFNYNPDLFWDANPAHSKAKLAPGPNNPVGVAWIDLSKEHYGIHGTPEPSRIGYTESHGCIRLTNWDVTRLAALVGPGTKVVLR